jgi:peptidoglycan/xylan/chitin deacetylase (PgdA/CDA1 family)
MASFGEHSRMLEDWRRFPGVERVDGERVVMTFDDGPDEDATPAILDALEAAGIRATFFVVGEQLMRHHSLARRAALAGHELALHGFAHPRHPELFPPDARDEVARGVGAFEAVAGAPPRFFRPPYGRFSEHSHKACGALGLEPAYWSAWGIDWYDIGAAEIADLVVRDLSAGSIVVLHDSARYGHRPSARPTADAIPAIAAAAAERGLEWVTLAEAVAPISSADG